CRLRARRRRPVHRPVRSPSQRRKPMRKKLSCLTALALLTLASLRAQEPGSPAEAPATRSEDRRQMAEDVQVLRRRLGRALAGPQMQACLSCHVQQVRFAPDGRVLSNQAFVVDPSSPCPVIRALAFSPDGKTLAAQGNDGTVRIWDPTTGKQL